MDKLANYESLNDLANDTNMLGTWTNVLVKKQTVYDALKAILGSDNTVAQLALIRGLFPNLNLPEIDKDIVNEMPADVTELPGFLSKRAMTPASPRIRSSPVSWTTPLWKLLPFASR